MFSHGFRNQGNRFHLANKFTSRIHVFFRFKFFKMLQSFLRLFPLNFGAYLIAVSSVSLSCGLLLTDVNFLQHLGMSQGNFGFVVVYFLSSLLLLVGVYQVIFLFHRKLFIEINFLLQENSKMLTPWMIVSMTGTIESFVASSINKNFSQAFCFSILIDVLFWFYIRNVYVEWKQHRSRRVYP